MQQVERAAASARQLGYQHGVDSPGLGERHDLAALGAVEPHA
jgi:hypothetical protein